MKIIDWYIIKKIFVTKIILGLATLAFLWGCVNAQSDRKYQDTVDIPINQEMTAELTSPPFVPKPVGNRAAKANPRRYFLFFLVLNSYFFMCKDR